MKRAGNPQDKSQPKKPKVSDALEGAPIQSNDGEGWTKVQKKSKKMRKAEAKSDMTPPRFMYSNTDIVKRHHAISIDDIRDFVLHIVADAPPPNWLRVEKVNLIQKCVVLLIPGLTPELLALPPLPTSTMVNPNVPIAMPLVGNDSSKPAVPFIANMFSHACPTRAPGDQTKMHSVLTSFFTGPVTGEERKKRIAKRLKVDVVKGDPTQYILTLEQMIENNYPIPSYMADVFEKSEDWLETPRPEEIEPKDNKDKQAIYAIDCEMCMTEDGKELARVCIIDHHSGSVVLDKLVKPAKPVLDYLTRWSGITAEILNPVTTTFAEVQALVYRLLSPPISNTLSSDAPLQQAHTPVLLGHSLESDLGALKIIHPLCIDTALMYHHPRGRPLKPGLAWLTKKWCGRAIQTRGEGGHDPEEDARACSELLKRKLEAGPGFGEFKIDHESIFERMGRANWRGGDGAGTVRAAVVDHGNPAVMHGSKATTAIGCKDDEAVLTGLLDVIPSHQFAFGRFMRLADTLGWTTPKATQISPPAKPAPPPSAEALAEVCTALDNQLRTLHAALPPRTAVVILTGHSDPRSMSALNARKSAFENAIRSGKQPEDLAPGSGWSAGDGRDLEEAVELARRGLLFLGIKQ